MLGRSLKNAVFSLGPRMVRPFSSSDIFGGMKPIKLFPDEPVFGAKMLSDSSHPVPPPLRQLRSWFNIFVYSFKYEKEFSYKDLMVGMRFVFCKISQLLNDDAMSEISSIVPTKLFEKISPAFACLSKDQKKKLFQFKESEIFEQQMFYVGFRNDLSNPRNQYIDVTACFICVQSVENLSLNQKSLQETIRGLCRSSIVVNLVFSKQVEPKLDEDWLLSNLNYMRYD